MRFGNGDPRDDVTQMAAEASQMQPDDPRYGAYHDAIDLTLDQMGREGLLNGEG